MGATKSLGQAGVVIEAPGADLFARRLQRWANAIENATPAFEQIVRLLGESEQQIFGSEGRSFGHPWPRAADPDRKVAPELLVASGALRNSLASQTGDSTRVVTPTELRFGTKVPYARYHEHGTSRMPARPMIGMSDQIRKQVVDAMHRYSVEQSERAG